MSDPTTTGKSSGMEPGGFSQDEIDALLRSAADSSGTDSAAATGAIGQDDIDALLQAGGLTAESATETGPAEVSTPAEAETRLDSMGRPFDKAAAMMQAAIEEERAAKAASAAAAPSGSAPAASPLPVQPYEFESLDVSLPPDVDPKRVSMLGDVNLRVKVQLGRTRMLVEEVLKLGEGSVVELDKLAGDPVDILVNDRLIARGEVLVLNDNFCVRVSEVLSNNPHRVTV